MSMAESFEPLAVDDTILITQESNYYKECHSYNSDLGNAFFVNSDAKPRTISMSESPLSTESSTSAGHDSPSQDQTQPLEGDVFLL